MTTYPLLIPYHQKDELKTVYKLRWDDKLKLWGTTSHKIYNKLSDYHIIELDVLYDNKELAKKLGAKWSGKKWVTSKVNYESNKTAYDSLRDPIVEEEPDTQVEK